MVIFHSYVNVYQRVIDLVVYQKQLGHTSQFMYNFRHWLKTNSTVNLHIGDLKNTLS